MVITDTTLSFRELMKQTKYKYYTEYKQGVNLNGVQDITKLYIAICSLIHYWITKKPMVVTSCTDGKHMEKSLHYKGLAFDVRIKDKTPEQVNKFVNFLKVEFDKNLDIVLEKDHIHIEYDPK